jgi:hypothetical protein
LAKTAEEEVFISVYDLNTFAVVTTNPMQTERRSSQMWKPMLLIWRGEEKILSSEKEESGGGGGIADPTDLPAEEGKISI